VASLPHSDLEHIQLSISRVSHEQDAPEGALPELLQTDVRIATGHLHTGGGVRGHRDSGVESGLLKKAKN
jgi:hypothetical protein